MSALFGVPVDAAYHAVSLLARLLTPAFGGIAAAAAIIVFTMAVRLLVLPLSFHSARGLEAQARVAPQVQALRRKYARQPERMQRELAALYEAEGTSMFAGFGPLLLQWPLLSVIYLLFRSPVIDGTHNALLSHDLFGAALGSHWLGAPGPLSAQGAVFAAVFVLLAAANWLTTRLARRRATQLAATTSSATPVAISPAARTQRSRAPRPAQPTRASHTPQPTRASRPTQPTRASCPTQPTRASRPAPRAAAPVQAGVVTRVLGWVTPFIGVVVAAFVPLAAGLYLVTTAVWTLGERVLLQRRSSPPAKREAVKPRVTA
ncbi:MAG TPA: YidC/Oxa1 family membrane protein insertase [Streptosporangiaceae bacterium]|jgi:YidC/Oxa1 family membrane protein insertase